MRGQRLIWRGMIFQEPLERRLLLAAGVDPSFGDGGIGTADTGVNGFHGTVMVRELVEIGQPVEDSKIVAVAGVGFSTAQGGSGISAAIARFNANGTLDTTFANNGVALIPIGDWVADAVMQSDDKIVVVGQSGSNLVVARINTDGTLDTTFGRGGIAEMPIQTAANHRFFATGAAFAPDAASLADGTIVASGVLRVGDDDSHLVLARFTAQGTPLTSFSGDGLVIENRAGWVDRAHVSVDSDNRVWVAASEASALGERVAVGRYTTAGVPDATFGTGGFVTLAQVRVGGDLAYSITAYRDEVLVGGEEFVARVMHNGSMNSSFSGDGIAAVPSELGVRGVYESFLLSGVTGVTDAGVFRLRNDGSRDPAFGTNGVVLIPGMTSSAITNRVSDDESVLVGGGTSAPTATIAVARIRERPGVVLGPTGVLVVTGDESDDTIRLEAIAGQAVLTFNGSPTLFPLNEVTGFNSEARGGNNRITLELNIPATVTAGDGDDTIVTADRDDTISAGDGDNHITTGAGRDTITTGQGSDTIITGAGDDIVRSGAGNDSITTGSGNDFIRAGDGNNTISSGAGDDDIRAGDGDDSIDAGAGNDIVLASGGNNTLHGGDGDDLLEGRDGNDSILGGAGNGRILAGNGDNIVFGGTGDDYIRAGNGNDTLWGEIGYDEIRGGFGDDYINGGAGKDRIFGQQGNDTIYAGRADDAIDGGPGNDFIKGGDGNDKIFDRDGFADTLFGGPGDDLALVDDELDILFEIETLLE